MNTVDLNSIKTPADIRNLSIDELKELAAQMRKALISKVSAHGGHVGPNLGMVEAVIALHYVFDTPQDKIVFDVSHQTYPHKMLTGRMDAFTDVAHYDDVTGYTNPSESDYDLFSLGHTSSAISLATGLAKARDMQGGHENVVAVIGDGSLGGGVALEGLDFGATLGSNFIVVVNDNDMSIAENHGGMYADLHLLRTTRGEGQPNLFQAMGYAYRYVHAGNDLGKLIEMFRSVKDIDHPVVVHINTFKGLGLKVAEQNKEQFHWHVPFDPETGRALVEDTAEDYIDIFAREMLDQMKNNPKVAVLTAGTPGAIGFSKSRREQAGKQFIDVGIAEQQAVDMAAGMAKGGVRPVFGVVSTFLQRAYDQFSQDAALNHQPAVFNVVYGSMFGMNDETHLGFFDLGLLSNIPGMIVLTPTSKQEYLSMLRWAIRQTESPVVVRQPGGAVIDNPDASLLQDYSKPAYYIVRKGSRAALIGVGTFLPVMTQAADLLAKDGIEVTVINPRMVSSLDTAALDALRNYDLVITAEDGIVDGGYGQKVASYLGEAPVKVVNLGLPKEFLNRYDAAEVQRACGMTPQQIAQRVTDSLR